LAEENELRRRRRRRLVVCLSAPLLGLIGCELLLRWFLFSESELAHSLGRPFRDAGLYVPSVNSDDYHLLYARLEPDGVPIQAFPHPELGWVGRRIDPLTLEQCDEKGLAGRRPVLLFGSSWAACSMSFETCFEHVLERSELGRELCLLNFGVPAYGPDQTWMLFERVLERFVALDPVVVFALVDDFDPVRATLSIFNLPKPRFVPEGDDYRIQPPDVVDRTEYLERHRPEIASYLWRYLRFGVELVPGAMEEREEFARRLHEEAGAITRTCLEKFSARCRAEGLEHFVLLFHDFDRFASGKFVPNRPSRELKKYLQDRSIPFVESATVVEAHLVRPDAALDALVERDHPNPRGTEVLAEALFQGLLGATRSPR
jgi:hypothetical protein